jgi:ribonucleoside-diphosphate reductase alpha chain/ribonucleoside-triphosphate reductase
MAIANFKAMQERRADVQGGNPCFEILLRDRGVCNLTEVNMMGFINADGTVDYDDLFAAQELSARIGYRMATIELELHEWNLVNDADRLTGCSLTGVMDFVNATGMDREEFGELLAELREAAHRGAYELADYLKLNRPLLTTAVKPSGTISQVAGVSSGVHFSHSPYYVRRVRVSANDPLANAMVASGFTWDPEVGQTLDNHKTKVFSFPVKAPEGRTKYDVGAIEQLELYQLIMKNYVDHNASNTVHVRNDEWEKVEEWIYNNWDGFVGVTFLSLDDNFYDLAPYESITKEKYDELAAKMPKFSASILSKFEDFSEEFDILDEACDTGACPIR